MQNCQVLTGKLLQNQKTYFLKISWKRKKKIDSSYFIGKSQLEEDVTQNYLVFQPISKYFKVIANTDYVSSWKSKELSAENITPPTISDNSLAPTLSYYGTKTWVKFTV